MGLFLHLSTIISTPKSKAIQALKDILHNDNISLEPVTDNEYEEELFIINYLNKNSSILFPSLSEHWDISKNISTTLNAQVLTLEIHDGDFWYFILYDNGNEIIKFNPIPQYYNENIEESEIKSWLPNADMFCKYFPNVKPKDIEKYFINWKRNGIEHWTDEANLKKAYSTDKYGYGNGLQLFDFINKLGIKYPIDTKGNVKGDKFQIKKVNTEQLEINPFKIAKQVLQKSKRFKPDFTPITEEEFEYLTGNNYVSYLRSFSGTLYCLTCKKRQPAVNLKSRLQGDTLTAGIYGQCAKCGSESLQLVSLFDAQKIIKLFE